MITLRDLVRTDTAIASITTDECHFIAKVLTFVWALEKRWFFRWLIPRNIRNEAFKMKMIGAVLGRTQKEREPSLNTQIKIAMEMDRKAAR